MGMSTLSAATSAFTVSMLRAGGQSIRMTSNASRWGASAWRSLISRPMGSVSRRTSAAVRSWLAGSSMKPPCSTATSAGKSSDSPSMTSQALRASWVLSTPLPMVALPWGSRSMSSTRRRVAAREAARLTAVVVLPTPPFWFAMAMTRFMGHSVLHRGARAGAPRTPGAGGPARGPQRPSGHQLVRGAAQALARHLVGDRVGGTVLAARALEDLREARRDAMDVGDDLRFGAATAILVRDADDAACVDDVVRRIQDAGGMQSRPVLSLRQLVIRGAGDDAGAQARDRLGIEHRSERARREHVDVLGEHLVHRHGARLEFIPYLLQRARPHVRDRQLRTLGRQQGAQVVAHPAHALHRDRYAPELAALQPEFHGRLDP